MCPSAYGAYRRALACETDWETLCSIALEECGEGARWDKAGWQLRARPNQGLELTAYSVRSYVAPAFGSSSGLAFGHYMPARGE
jgi:hypothetical protein